MQYPIPEPGPADPYLRGSRSSFADVPLIETKIASTGNMEVAPIHFPRFKELPKAIRIRVWAFAASIPRVVELHEHHSTILRDGKREYHTAVGSRTRPPALLQACAEAKRVALNIFIPMYKHAHSNCSPHTPIYVNPHTDITYRGMDTEPFRLLGPDHRKDVVPLGETRTLAVNSKFLAKIHMVGPLPFEPCPEKGDFFLFTEQIMACADRGLAELIFVVGNDEDHAEFEMEDVDPYDVRAKQALYHAELLRFRIKLYRPENHPKIKVMKVKSRRHPIPPFHQFSRLPQELQNIIWDYASETRRVISVKNAPYPYYGPSCRAENSISHRCQPPLLSVCRASRTIAMKKLTRIPWTSRARPSYYNKSRDVVIMPRFDRYPPAFFDWNIKYLGLHSSGLELNQDACFVHTFRGVRKVFLIIGECHPNSEITLMPINQSYELGRDGVIRFNNAYCEVQNETALLSGKLSKVASMHNEIQRERAAEGKERNPDLRTPVVRAAKMVPVSRVVSPYSYKWSRN